MVQLRAFNAVLAFGLLIQGLLQGCALVQNQQANDAESVLIGRRREEIMACAGVPNQDRTAGDKEIATYFVAARHLASGIILGQPRCIVTIEFKARRVSSVTYALADPGILAPLESCAEIVAGCLR